MRDAALLAQVLRHPSAALRLTGREWPALISTARAEQLVGSLAFRLAGLDLPPAATRILADVRASAEQGRVAALWEAEMAWRALRTLEAPVVLLKGTAFVAAGLSPGVGRSIGDLDILVPRPALEEVERRLLAAGWEWVKPDPYDDAYYRRWMHELPPLIHRDRDKMIDVHHTILPLTARDTPDAAALIADSVVLANGLRVPCPEDLVVHAAIHLFGDGDLAGGMRNLWDIDRLLREFGEEAAFWSRLADRARLHQAGLPVARAVRQAQVLYDTPIQGEWRGGKVSDALFRRRLLARDGWGRATRPVTRLGFYVRSHWLRMPPAMLARHLWTKWRKGGVPQRP